MVDHGVQLGARAVDGGESLIEHRKLSRGIQPRSAAFVSVLHSLGEMKAREIAGSRRRSRAIDRFDSSGSEVDRSTNEYALGADNRLAFTIQARDRTFGRGFVLQAVGQKPVEIERLIWQVIRAIPSEQIQPTH